MSGKNIKVGILTFHRAYNYGAILQAYALQKVIRRLGIRCEVIDYWNVEKKRNHALFRIDFQMGISRNLSKLIKDIYRTWKNKNFNQFMHNVSMLSERKYSTLEELREMDVHEGYNVYVVGSDQVWNIENNSRDEAFLLIFTDNNDKKCSYAASFGSAELDAEMQQRYADELEKFRVISIREEDALEKFPFLRKDKAVVVLDPTLLLDRRDYVCISSKRIIKQKYAFIYTIPKENRLSEYARKICKQNSLVLVDSKKSMSFFINSKPEDFLSFFDNAEFVFTNSFHGTAFSIIMKKLFATEINVRGGGTNNRSKELLLKLDLLDRDIDSPNHNILKEINYDIVDITIDSMKEVSMNVLKEIVLYC